MLRQLMRDVLPWAALFFVAIIVGASAFQRIALIPQWSGDLPGSLIRYFQGTQAAPFITRFWSSVTPLAALSVAAALAANWPDQVRRKWPGASALLFFAGLIWTVVWFIPQGVTPLMIRAGAGMSPEEITRRLNAWIFWDWFRLALVVSSYLLMLKALMHRSG